MKTRNGFVSNSSSSSFVVAFKTVPESAAELSKILFGDDAEYPNPYPWKDANPSWPSDEIAEIVFRDMSKEATKEEMLSSVRGGYLEGSPDYHDFEDKTAEGDRFDTIDWDAYHVALNNWADKRLAEFQSAHPDCKFFQFEYSDNDGDLFCAMEHGPLFDRLPHLRCSHH